jgi:hypothetical protein
MSHTLAAAGAAPLISDDIIAQEYGESKRK